MAKYPPMARLKTVYRCQQCGHSAAKPMGQCPGCSEWNTMAEEVIEALRAETAASKQKAR